MSAWMEGLRRGWRGCGSPRTPESTHPSPVWSQQRRQKRRGRRRLRSPQGPRQRDAGVRHRLLPHLSLWRRLRLEPGIAGVAAPGRPLSPPHAPTSTPSRGPGTAAWLHPGTRRGEEAAWEASVGRQGCPGKTRARRAEVLALPGFRRLGPHPPPGAPSPPFAALRWAWVGARRSPVVSLASRPHLPVSKRPTPGPGAPGPAPAPGVTLREGEGCECPDSVGWGSCREHGDGGGGPGVRGRRGCSAGPGTPGSTHPSPATASSSGGSGGGGGGCVGSAAPGAPGWEMLASAAVSCPIPGSGGCCSGLQASRASRPRPGPYPRLTPPPPPLPAVQAGPPGCTLGRGAGEGPLGRRAWGEKGAEASPERGEQRCRLPLGSVALDPAPPPPEPPPLCSLPRAGPGEGGVGAVGTVDS